MSCSSSVVKDPTNSGVATSTSVKRRPAAASASAVGGIKRVFVVKKRKKTKQHKSKTTTTTTTKRTSFALPVPSNTATDTDTDTRGFPIKQQQQATTSQQQQIAATQQQQQQASQLGTQMEVDYSFRETDVADDDNNNKKDADNDDDDAIDIPCDTLLALQSLTRSSSSSSSSSSLSSSSSSCLHIPLFDNGSLSTVPCVLESQLHQLLRTQSGYDSIVTAELQQLVQTNKVRRLVSLDAVAGAAKTNTTKTTKQRQQHNVVEVIMETHYYKRAVWDAHRHYWRRKIVSDDVDNANTYANANNSTTTTAAFLQCLDQVTTKRIITRRDLQHHWPSSSSTKAPTPVPVPPFTDEILDRLVQMQVLLPYNNTYNNNNNDGNAYLLWLPHWGLVLKHLDKAQRQVMLQLKRSFYKELSKSNIEQQLYSSGSSSLSSSSSSSLVPLFSGLVVLHILESQGLVRLKERPSGTFVCLK